MEIEVLGSGGAIATPRPGCACALCTAARERGVPWARSGPSVLVHGPDLLIDTPEEARHLLAHGAVRRVRAGCYSHWHPDHTAGWRVWEAIAGDFRAWPAFPRPATVFLPARVNADFERRLGLGDAFRYLVARGFVDLRVIGDEEEVEVHGASLRPVPLAEAGVSAFLLADRSGRALVAMDEIFGWSPPPWLCDLELDVAVLPTGLFEHDPFTGERRIAKEHPLLSREHTFPQAVEVARRLRARLTVFAHVEEPDGNSPADLERLAATLRAEGLAAVFAHDGLRLPVGRAPAPGS